MGEIRIAYRILLGKTERKCPLGRPRHRWNGNIKMNDKGTECEIVEWNQLVDDRAQNCVYLNKVMGPLAP
jgi:hypothetical protein